MHSDEEVPNQICFKFSGNNTNTNFKEIHKYAGVIQIIPIY